MQLLVLFGLPGTGKTYVGKILEKDFGFFLHDGDTDLPQDMKEALIANEVVSDNMRERFFQNIITRAKHLTPRYKKVVVTQTFIKEIYRNQFLNVFPTAQFILVKTPTTLREQRLKQRKEYPLDETYARNMVDMFDNPLIPYLLLTNNTNGAEEIKTQLNSLLK
jgi:gluconate kinase